MAEETTVPGAAQETVTPEAPQGAATTPDPPADPARPNPVKQLREALDKEKAEKAALADRLKALEDAQLSEADKLKRENDELKPVRDEHGRFKSVLQETLDAELASVPEDRQEAVRALMGDGPVDAQLKALRAAKALIPAAPPAPRQAGTHTQPQGGQAPTLDEQIAAAEKAGNRSLSIQLKTQKMRA